MYNFDLSELFAAIGLVFSGLLNAILNGLASIFGGGAA